ncbi:MAG: hypothetical protein SVV88_17415, partial [Pseudomonadota bacterium]|nr:hypothetical protein [Pseudomonadota bacterium]
LILNFLFRRFKTEVLLNSVSSSCLAMRWRSPSQWGRIIGRSENRSTLFLDLFTVRTKIEQNSIKLAKSLAKMMLFYTDFYYLI